eukprot:2612965-Amphidinium_carterae.1
MSESVFATGLVELGNRLSTDDWCLVHNFQRQIATMLVCRDVHIAERSEEHDMQKLIPKRLTAKQRPPSWVIAQRHFQERQRTKLPLEKFTRQGVERVRRFQPD